MTDIEGQEMFDTIRICWQLSKTQKAQLKAFMRLFIQVFPISLQGFVRNKYFKYKWETVGKSKIAKEFREKTSKMGEGFEIKVY